MKFDSVQQVNARRLDGPRLPKGKKSRDYWLDDTIMACARHVLVANEVKLCEQSSGRKRACFVDSYMYTKLMQTQRQDSTKGVYRYSNVAGQCKKMPEGNLLSARACYLPVLVHESHWVGGAILPGKKEIVLYNPGGKDTQNGCVLKNLLRLVGDEYRRTGNYSQKQVIEYLGQWRLVDLASDTKYSSPRQENGE